MTKMIFRDQVLETLENSEYSGPDFTGTVHLRYRTRLAPTTIDLSSIQVSEL